MHLPQSGERRPERGDRVVVGGAARKGAIKLAAQGHQRAERAGHAADLALERAQAILIRAVNRFAAHGFRTARDQDIFAAVGDADRGIGEVTQELAQGGGINHHIGVAEDQNPGGGRFDQAVEHAGFTVTSGELNQAHPGIIETADNFIRAVGGAVGADEDFELAVFVFKGEGVLYFPADHTLFVVGGDQQRSRGPLAFRKDRRLHEAAAEQAQRERIKKVRVQHGAEGQPENDQRDEFHDKDEG